MDALDIVTACQGWHLASTATSLDAPTTITLHLYDAFSLRLHVIEDIAGTKTITGHLAVLPPGMAVAACRHTQYIWQALCPCAGVARRLKPGVRRWAAALLEVLSTPEAWAGRRGWRLASELRVVGADLRCLLMQVVQQHGTALEQLLSLASQLETVSLATPSLLCASVGDGVVVLVFGSVATNMRLSVQLPVTASLLAGTEGCSASLQWAGSSGITQAALDTAVHGHAAVQGRHVVELVARVDALSQMQRPEPVGQHTPRVLLV